MITIELSHYLPLFDGLKEVSFWILPRISDSLGIECIIIVASILINTCKNLVKGLNKPDSTVLNSSHHN